MMVKFLKGFVYAVEGICLALKKERNLKIQAAVAVVVTIAAFMTGISQTEWFIILILFGGVFALEMMNSAVERAVDLVTVEQHPLAKQAKDLAAGAVLVFAIFSAIIGLLLFIPKWFM